MPNIYARSPYIVSIDEASQIRTKVEVYLSTGINTSPTSPSYTLSKYIPSSNVTETVYNISPFIREYIANTEPESVTYPYTLLSSDKFCTVYYKKYKDIGAGWVYVSQSVNFAFDGYTDFSDGANYENASYFLKDEGIYYYDPTDTSNRPNIVVLGDFGFTVNSVKYTPLETGLGTTTVDVSSIGQPFTLVGFPSAYASQKNKCEILDDTNTVRATYYFYPITECKHTPVRIDYINKYGAWDRFWFFKTSTNTITTTSKTYNTMQSNWDYNVKVGTTSVLNKTGREKIRLSSGFVEEAVNSQIRQIMLSEKILVGGKPAVLKTDSVELFKHVNQKQINYTMEFEYAYDLVNNVL